MRLLVTFLCIVFFSPFVFGGNTFDIGVKYGLNSSTMVTNFDQVLSQNIQLNDINNHHAGAFVRINMGKAFAQPEVYFNTKGGIIDIGVNQLQVPTRTSFEYQTIDVPVLLGYKVLCTKLINLRVNVGPVFSFLTANSFYSEISNLNSSDFKNSYMGWQFGAGVDVWFLTFDARIENSSNIIMPENPFTAKNRTYLLSVGIKLF